MSGYLYPGILLPDGTIRIEYAAHALPPPAVGAAVELRWIVKPGGGTRMYAHGRWTRVHGVQSDDGRVALCREIEYHLRRP